MKKVESLQYDAALAVSGAWRGTSREKLYKDLGWESLHARRELRRICLFRDIVKDKQPAHLYNNIKHLEPNQNARGPNAHSLKTLYTRTEHFKSTFFPSCVLKWNLLDHPTKNLPSQVLFKNHI